MQKGQLLSEIESKSNNNESIGSFKELPKITKGNESNKLNIENGNSYSTPVYVGLDRSFLDNFDAG